MGASGSPVEAAERLGRAIDLFTRSHMPHKAARAHLALARGVASKDPGRAVEEARQALEAFEQLGATRDADMAASFLRGLGARGRTGPKLLGELSKREIEVLRLLGYGLTNAEIAARLYISTKTVATHVGNIFAKLQVRNRAEAATFAQRLLEDGPP
jgi:DNA-binding NarL/FixJ family response regulator